MPAFGEVGSYVLGGIRYADIPADFATNRIVPGSVLKPVYLGFDTATTPVGIYDNPTVLTGTWQAMNNAYTAISEHEAIFLFQRIA